MGMIVGDYPRGSCRDSSRDLFLHFLRTASRFVVSFIVLSVLSPEGFTFHVGHGKIWH